jgi:uroporphyrinogen-III synthase
VRVLVPRGGAWGERVAGLVVIGGGTALVAPLLDFAPPDDQSALRRALDSLATGGVDWLVVTSATTVPVLDAVAEGTRIAAVGVSTERALREAGYPVDFVPQRNSSRGLALELPEPHGRVMVLQSAAADPALAVALHAERVDAYRPVPVAASAADRREVASGAVDVILVTSGTIAREVVAQFPDIPESTRIACIGPETAVAARAAGLRVDAVAAVPTAEALVEAALSL